MKNIETILCEKIKMSYGFTIPEDVIRNLRISEVRDIQERYLKVFLETFIPGRKIREETRESVIVYQDWWNHFRACHFPKWLNKRFPVKSKHEPVKMVHYHLCPHTGIDFRNDEKFRHIVFLQGEENDLQVRETIA